MKLSNFAKAILYFFFLITNVLAALNDYKLVVKNGLLDNITLLTIHCASGDNDLGFHELRRGEVFEWKFRTDYFDRTLYFCHFWWEKKDAVFDVFNYSFSVKHCAQRPEGNTCIWIVREDGFYFQEQGFDEDLPHPEPPAKLRDW